MINRLQRLYQYVGNLITPQTHDTPDAQPVFPQAVPNPQPVVSNPARARALKRKQPETYYILPAPKQKKPPDTHQPESENESERLTSPQPNWHSLFSIPECVKNNLLCAFTQEVQLSPQQETATELYIPTTSFPERITSENLRTVFPGEKLNDIIINISFKILQQRAQNTANNIRCLTYDSFQLDRIRRILLSLKTTPVKYPLFSLETHDRIFFPVNVSNIHWLLVVVDNIKEVIFSVDSLGSGQPALEIITIQNWLCLCLINNNKLNDYYRFKNYRVLALETPVQSNAHDCGPAIIFAAAQLYQGADTLKFHTTYTEFRGTILKTLRGCSVIKNQTGESALQESEETKAETQEPLTTQSDT